MASSYYIKQHILLNILIIAESSIVQHVSKALVTAFSWSLISVDDNWNKYHLVCTPHVLDSIKSQFKYVEMDAQ